MKCFLVWIVGKTRTVLVSLLVRDPFFSDSTDDPAHPFPEGLFLWLPGIPVLSFLKFEIFLACLELLLQENPYLLPSKVS